MMRIGLLVASVLAVGLSGCGVPTAAADAIMPPPKKCPPGKIGVSSHRGPQCVDDVPKNCPAGWRGYPGQFCVLEICNTDGDCDKGKHCKTAELCVVGQTVVDVCRSDRGGEFDPADAQDPSCPPSSKCDKTQRVCLPDSVAKPGTWRGRRGKAS